MLPTATMDAPATRAVRQAKPRRGTLFAGDRYWAAAFATPYAVVFLVFVIYPIGYGLWLGSNPASYRALWEDPIYPRTITNTLLYLLFGVNLKLALAMMLSGFFAARRLVVQSIAVGVHVALGDPGAAKLSQHQLDAERAMGPDQ
jgi:multiple sugar transport system permease protein